MSTNIPVSQNYKIGISKSYRYLRVFPVQLKQPKSEDEVDYITLDEGLEKEVVVITEIGGEVQSQDSIEGLEELIGPEESVEQLEESIAPDIEQIAQQALGQEQAYQQEEQQQFYGGADVNRLKIRNDSDRYLYLMAGEIILGAKQDRMVAQDVVIEPHSQDIPLDVFCVEQGRWEMRTTHFTSANTLSYSTLRREAQVTKNQGQVWENIATKSSKMGVETPTGTLDDVYSDSTVQEKIEEYEERLLRAFEENTTTVGVVVAIDEQIICLDVYQTPQLFQKLWPKLLKSYIMDTLDCEDETAPFAEKQAVSISSAEKFLTEALDSETTLDVEEEAVNIYRVESENITGVRSHHKDQEIHMNVYKN